MTTIITRLPALDGLRAFSILLVVLSHAGLGKWVPGGLGVTIFFFISGFIITRLLLLEVVHADHIAIVQFYLRRFTRLFPALFCYVSLSWLVLKFSGVEFDRLEIWSVFLYFVNYYGIYLGPTTEAFVSPFSITWSLAIEEHFYLIFPFIFAALIGSARRFASFLISGLLVILAWRCYLVYGVGLDDLPRYRLYKASDTRIDSIIWGVLFSLMWFRSVRFQRNMQTKCCALAGVVLLVLSLVIRDENFRESWRYSIQGLALFLLCASLIYQQGRATAWLRWGWMQYLGKISYSLYLYHWLVYGVLDFYASSWPWWSRALSLALLSLVMASASYHWIEQPGIRLGRRLMAKTR